MYRYILYKILNISLSLIFFITNSASYIQFEPSAHTLRPVSEAIAGSEGLAGRLKSPAKDPLPAVDSLADILARIPPAAESTTKLVILDWGNVIAPYDLSIPAAEFARRFQIDKDLVLEFLKGESNDPNNPIYRNEMGTISEDECVAEIMAWMEEHSPFREINLPRDDFERIFSSDEKEAFPEMIALIRGLREKGYKIRVLTKTNAIHYKFFMRHIFPLLGIEESDVFASFLTKVAKPAQESYEQVLRHAGVKPVEAMFVDDNKSNIAVAKKAGLTTCQFDASDVLGSLKSVADTLDKAGQLQGLLDTIPPAEQSLTKLVIVDWGKVITPYDFHILARKLAERFGVDEKLAFEFFEERNTNPKNPVYQYENGQINGEELTKAIIGWIRESTGQTDVEMSVEEFEDLFNSVWMESSPEVVLLINALREKGYKICVLSRTNDIHYRYFMKNVAPLIGIEAGDFFASHITKLSKPSMESYLAVLKHYKVEAENAMFWDDRLDCHEGAVRTGIKSFLFNPKDVTASVKGIVNDLKAQGVLKRCLDAILPAEQSPIKVVILDSGNVVAWFDYNRAAKELNKRYGVDKRRALDFFKARYADTDNPIYQFEHGTIEKDILVWRIRQWLARERGANVIFNERDYDEIFIEKLFVGDIPEIVSLIKVLRQKGYMVRGLSTLNKEHAKLYANPEKRLGIARHLEKPEHLYASCDTGYAKPDPRSYLDVIRDTKVSPGEALFVDDAQRNIDGAKNVGLNAQIFDPENPSASVRNIAIRLSEASVLSGVEFFPDKPIELDDRVAFVVIKPDGQAKRNELIKEFADAEFEIISIVDRKEPMDIERWKQFYGEHPSGDDVIGPQAAHMASGPVTLVVLRGEKDAFQKVRDMLGPWQSDRLKPGTLRYKYGVSNVEIRYIDSEGVERRVPSIVSKIHGSDSARTVLREIGITHTREELSRIISASSIPEVDTQDEYLKELGIRFNIVPDQAKAVESRFAEYLRKALAGEPSEIRINKSYIGIPLGNEQGTYVRLEVGGTNVRVGMVTLYGGRRYEIFPFELEKKIPPELKKGDGSKLFDFFAECVAEFLRKIEAEGHGLNRYKLIFIFSFGLVKTAIDEAVTYEMTKEFRVKGVIGKRLKDLLSTALEKEGVREKIDIVAIGNDTEPLTAGASYLFVNCLLALILSTGHNVGLVAQGDIWNAESGNWKDDAFLRQRSSFDIFLDMVSADPTAYASEKMLSGTYVGEIARMILLDMIKRGLLFGGENSSYFATPWKFETKYLDAIEKHTIEDTKAIGEFLETLGIENISDKDCQVVWRVADMVTTKAAYVTAILLAANINNSGFDFQSPLNILAEGTFVQKSPVMQRKIITALSAIMSDEKAAKINLVVNRDATKVGAAVMGAIAERMKSSSAGALQPTTSFKLANISFEPLKSGKEPPLKYLNISIAKLREAIISALYKGSMIADTMRELLGQPDFSLNDISEVRIKYLEPERIISRVYLVTVKHKRGEESFILDIDACPSLEKQKECYRLGEEIKKSSLYSVPASTHRMFDNLKEAYGADSRFMVRPLAKSQATITVDAEDGSQKEVTVTMTSRESLEGWDGVYVIPSGFLDDPKRLGDEECHCGIIRSWNYLYEQYGVFDYEAFAKKFIKILVIYYIKLNQKAPIVILNSGDLMVYHPDIKKCGATSPEDFGTALGIRRRTKFTDVHDNMKIGFIYELIPMEKKEFITALWNHKERTFNFGEDNIFSENIIRAGIKDALDDVYGSGNSRERKKWLDAINNSFNPVPKVSKQPSAGGSELPSVGMVKEFRAAVMMGQAA